MNISPSFRQVVSVAAVVLAAVYAYSLVTLGHFYFPVLAISLFLTTLATAVFILKKPKTSYDSALFAITLILSISVTVRANEFLTFLNIVGSLYFGSFLIMSAKERETMPVLHLLFAPLIHLLQFLTGENIFPLEMKDYSKNISGKKAQDLIASLAITLVIFIIIVPLLASANPLFEKLVGDIGKALNVFAFLGTFFGPSLIGHILRFFIFLFFILWLPRLFTSVVQNKSKEYKVTDLVFPLFIPKVLTSLLLLVFFITQLQLYFSSAETLKAMGMMNREYAREVFGQLSIVSCIIFALLYMDRGTSKINRMMNYVLVAQIMFLNFIALKSVYDYTERFGFTHKRLWGYTGVVWLFGAVLLYVYAYGEHLKRTVFLQNIIVFTGIVLIGVNIANFDYLMFHVSRSRTGEGVDHHHLAFMLSPDADSYKEHTEELIALFGRNKGTNNDVFAAWRLIEEIARLKQKYAERADWRSFNLAEYMQFKKVESMNTAEYRDIANKYHQKLSINPQ